MQISSKQDVMRLAFQNILILNNLTIYHLLLLLLGDYQEHKTLLTVLTPNYSGQYAISVHLGGFNSGFLSTSTITNMLTCLTFVC